MSPKPADHLQSAAIDVLFRTKRGIKESNKLVKALIARVLYLFLDRGILDRGSIAIITKLCESLGSSDMDILLVRMGLVLSSLILLNDPLEITVLSLLLKNIPVF